jgi:hypothetical protein
MKKGQFLETRDVDFDHDGRFKIVERQVDGYTA